MLKLRAMDGDWGRYPESYNVQTRDSYRRQYATHPERFTIPEPPSAWSLGTIGMHV
jgi:hypothetical protein